jgi:hypothetical protein
MGMPGLCGVSTWENEMAPQAVREGKHKKDSHLEPNNRTTRPNTCSAIHTLMPESGLGDDFLAPAFFLQASVRPFIEERRTSFLIKRR